MPSQVASASRKSQGVWAKSAMMATDMTVPTSVPSNRASPFCTTMPDSGWATMKAVISAHCGCSRPKRNAHQSASPAPSKVLMTNCSAGMSGARKARRVSRTGKVRG
ncbi:hypothetical protein D9M68_479290 [compost metagenome]